MALYDRIGRGYAEIRRPDPRLAASIRAAAGDARSLLDVGAGTGSYEPVDLEVTAVEPSAEMIAQRPPGAPQAVQGVAERLPFPDDSFDTATAILTVHHWDDVEAGLAELRRVARRRVVVVTLDAHVCNELWIVRDYLPEAAALNLRTLPPLPRLLEALPAATVQTLPVPHDCADRMFAALWARPEAYLDPRIREAASIWHRLPEAASARALGRLRRDLDSGAWDERHGHLRTRATWDVGLRLLRAELSAGVGPSHPGAGG